MALPHAVGIAVPRVRRIPWRFVATALVPAFDGAFLLAAIIALAPLSLVEVLFVLSAGLVLNAREGAAGRRSIRLSDDLGWLLGCMGTLSLLFLPLATTTGSTESLALLGSGAAAAVVTGRGLSYALIRMMRTRSLVIESAVILGSGRVGRDVASILMDHPEFGLAPIGFLGEGPPLDLPLPVLGDVRDLPALVESKDVRHVIVAFSGDRDADVARVLRVCERPGVQTYIVPRFFERVAGHGGAFDDELWGFPLVRLGNTAFTRRNRLLKRGFDVVVSGTTLLLAAPFFAAAALAVKLSSPGPIFYRQKRITQDGRVFEVLKFRSMTVHDSGDTDWSVVGDSRVTRAGRFLRASSIDEIPQLLNILKGEMSLVGPRPERPFYVDRFSMEIDSYEDRHRVLGGVTGWAQVHGLRGDTSIEERARFDNRYIARWSLWLDVVTIVKTFGAVFRMVKSGEAAAPAPTPGDPPG